MRSWMKKARTLILFGALMLILSACGKENLTALVPKGYGSEKSFYLIVLTTIVMTFVFLSVMIIYIIVLIRFRMKKSQEVYILKQVNVIKTLEIACSVILI